MTLVQFVTRLTLPVAPTQTTASGPHTTMSTASTADDARLQTNSSPTFAHTPKSLQYAAAHVFIHMQPFKFDSPDMLYTPENDHSLARAVSTAAHAYTTYINETPQQAQWNRITKMLDNLQASVQSEHLDANHVISQLREMQTGGMSLDSLYYLR